jgi:hypothetical protein
MYQELPRPGHQIYPDTGVQRGTFSRQILYAAGQTSAARRTAIAGIAELSQGTPGVRASEIVGEYYDAAIWGADPIEGRPGFAAVLERIDSNGVRLALVSRRSAS